MWILWLSAESTTGQVMCNKYTSTIETCERGLLVDSGCGLLAELSPSPDLV